jgi:hypothetical protein
MMIVTIGILAMVQSFGYIQKAIQSSKNRTLASNLAQEKMQILKQKVYYQVLVTSDPAHDDTDFAPESISYDTGYFPPEIITEAGVTYTRYTYVQVAREDSGKIVELAPNIPDTGMRLITVTVVWSQNGTPKKLSLRSLMANPDTVMATAVFSGQVRNSVTLTGIQGALVNVAESMGWRDTSDSSGMYSIGVSPGNYTLVASADGYYTQVRPVSIGPNATQTQGFDLVKIATGSVSGAAWLRNHLVISQVVASTTMPNGNNAEYIELYNPTSQPVNIGSSSAGNQVKVKYLGEPGLGQDINQFALTYTSTYVAAGHYYLIANTSALNIGGTTPAVDAVFSSANGCPTIGSLPSCIQATVAGAIVISDASGNTLDTVGWSHGSNGKNAPASEGAQLSMYDGFPIGTQLQRTSEYKHTTEGYGRAYDSNDNTTDFNVLGPMTELPYGSASGVFPVLTGTPAVGAIVTASDGVSDSTTAWLCNGVSSFTLVNVATGTWIVLISSNAYELENDTVTITGPGVNYAFASTATVLASPASTGFITGRVISALGVPISPAIVVSPGGAGTASSANTGTGRYTLRVAPGSVDVTVNPTIGGNSSYVTMSSNSITVAAGQVYSGVDFVLYQGGRISGFVTRDGINALPGVSVAVFDVNGIARDVQVSGVDGRFTTMNISTGSYSVQPEVDSLETTTPSSATVSLVTQGATMFSSTFTISGAMGTITGTVKAGGQPIKTGVLIVVTTVTLSGTPPVPPVLSTATLTGSPYYLASSMEDGTFSVSVRQSVSPAYNVYGYYAVPSGNVANISSAKVSNVPVTAGQTYSGVNFSW